MSAATSQVRDCMSMRLITVDASDSVYDAAEIMTENHVGCTVVMQNDDIAGIITKGDIIKNCLLTNQDPKKVRASSIMSTPVVTVSPDDSLEQAAKKMSARNVSKLPVVDDESGLLVGMITSTDVMRIEPSYVEYLKELIHSRSSSSSSSGKS